MYWGQWSGVPEGMRVAVWIDADASRLRGTWDLPPWHGELSGSRQGPRFLVDWREEGTVAVLNLRVRRVTLSVGANGALSGGDVSLARAGFHPPGLAPGLWLGRWTGLPPGVAVETLLSRSTDGHWRAAYRYQQREGSFDGTPRPGGGLAIRWMEVSPGNNFARGEGLLDATRFGLSGTYGINEMSDGTGFWSLEPAP